jgi:hypothetical protein
LRTAEPRCGSPLRLTLPSRVQLPGYALQLPLMSNVSAQRSVVRKQRIYVGTLILVSVMAASYEGVLYWRGVASSERLIDFSQLAFIVLLVLWVDADSKTHPNIYRPYEFGQLVLLFWLPYLPFYLWRTRRVSGMLLFLGFFLLFSLGYLVQLVIYIVR